MFFFIKAYDTETGVFLLADSDPYDAESELDALHIFSDTLRNDVTTESVIILNDDPDDFLIRVKGWIVDDEENKFKTVEEDIQLLAVKQEEL